MKCLNCGHAVHTQEENCPHCNIPLNYYGLVHEVVSAEIPEQKIEGCTCPNCNGIQNDPEAIQCEYCNYPLDDSGTSEGNKQAAKPDTGFAWRNVGQSRFSMNCDKAFEQMFQKPGIKLSY